MFRGFLTATMAAGIVAISAPQTAFAQSNPWIGTWKTNLAKSTYNPGPPPRSQIVTIQEEGQGGRLTVETINAQGNPLKFVVVRPHIDGKPYPVMGIAAFDAEAIKAVNDSTSVIIRTKDGKIVSTEVSVISADGKTMTNTFTGVNAREQPFYNFVIYDKHRVCRRTVYSPHRLQWLPRGFSWRAA